MRNSTHDVGHPDVYFWQKRRQHSPRRLSPLLRGAVHIYVLLPYITIPFMYGIFTIIYQLTLICMVNVGICVPNMDPMGITLRFFVASETLRRNCKFQDPKTYIFQSEFMMANCFCWFFDSPEWMNCWMSERHERPYFPVVSTAYSYIRAKHVNMISWPS